MSTSRESTLDLLRRLKVPTFEPAPDDTRFVESYADFLNAINYSDKEFRDFSASLLGSLNTADLSDYSEGSSRDKAVDALSDALNSMLITLQEKRNNKNRFFNIPSRLQNAGHSDTKAKVEIAVDESFERRFRDAHTMIGPIPLDPGMPVSEVEITENYSAQTTRTLRSGTDTVVKGHKSDIVMAITIEVPANRINDRGPGSPGLMTLLATLKAFPVCEIVSSAITPVFVNSILAPELFESVRKQVAEEVASQKISDIQNRTDQIKALQNPVFGESLASFKRFIGTLNPVVDFMIRDDKNDTEALNQQDIPMSLAVAKLNNYKGAVSVPCAYMGCIVKTSPNKTNHLTVKLFFRRFNDSVWSPYGKIFYRDRDGKPTPNVTECPWIERIAMMMFTNGLDNPGNYMKPYQHKLSDEESGMVFMWPDPKNVDSTDPTTMVPSVYKPHGKSWIIRDIEARSFMKMIQLPMLGSPYPTAQYMGLDNVHARVTVTITDAMELARFHEMKAALDKLNFDAGPNSMRHHFVSIENNLLNFLGASEFVITGITTQRSSDQDLWNVEFELLESSVSLNESESIILKDEAFKETGDIKKIWDHIYKLLAEQASVDYSEISSDTRITLESARPNNSRVPDTVKHYRTFPKDKNHPRGYELEDEGQMAWRLVFEKAGDRGSGSILQPNIMAATWFSLAMKSREKGNKFSWSTSFRNEPRINAVLEGRGFEARSAWGTGGANVLLSNDRTSVNIGELGLFSGSTPIQSGGDKTRIGFFFITGRFNPTSIFEFSDLTGTPGNRIIKTTEDAIFDTWPKLNSFERIAQSHAADWLSKGQYNIDSDGSQPDNRTKNAIGMGNAISDSASTNIFEQGMEMLDWMSTGDARRTVFFDKDFWDEYFRILYEGEVRPDTDIHSAWSQNDITDARWKLTSLLRQGAYLDFPSIQSQQFETLTAETRFVRTNLDEEDLDAKSVASGKYEAIKSNYADMHLPTYARVFKNDSTGDLITTKEGKELWREFAPTFSDIGVKPPYIRSIAFETVTEAINKIARRINDPIEPDAIYYHFRFKAEGLAKHIDEQGNRDSHLKEIKNHPRITVPKDTAAGGSATVDTYLKEVWKVPNERYLEETFNKNADHELLRAFDGKKIQSIVVIDEEGNLLGNVISNSESRQGFKFNQMLGVKSQIFSGDGASVVDHYDGTEVGKAARDLILRSDDRTGSMSKLFPAYRLYFIEQDRGFRFLADDLYGVNCLINLSLRKDKEDADVLIATISNTTDNLSNMRVLSEAQTKKLGLSKDDAGEPFFSSLKLQSGVCVQLRMGYGSNPDDLPIVFTGMITEIQPGKIVQITCQGHKRELLNEIQFDMQSINHFDIIRKVLEKCEHPNLGDTMTAGRYSNAAISTRFAEGQNPDDFIGITDQWHNRKVVDMSNIYIVSNAPLESGRKVYFDRNVPILNQDAIFGTGKGNGATRFGNGLTNLEQFGTWLLTRVTFGGLNSWYIDVGYTNGKWAKWVIPPQSAWSAIQEVARHRPGTITQVVPYDSRGTLFVGQPEQTYQYTEPNHAELLTYSLLSGSMVKRARFDFTEQIIRPFMESSWSGLYKSHFGWKETNQAIRGENSRDFKKSTDASLFVDHDDVLELDEIPDTSDKQSVFDQIGTGDRAVETRDRANKLIRIAAGGDLPVGFVIETHWWMYPNDIRDKVEYLNSISPTMVESLFMWYYDLDPVAAELVLPSLLRDIGPLFFATDGRVMEDFKNQTLNDPNTPLSTNYGRLKNAISSLNSVELKQGKEEEQLKFLIAQKLVTDSEAEVIRSKLFSGDSSIVQRNQLNDPVVEILNKSTQDSLAHIIAKTGGGFRLFLFNMYHFLQRERNSEITTLNEHKVRNAVDKLRGVDLPPGKKVFRAYHYVTTGDIIENNIIASMNEMSNSCLVRAPAEGIKYKIQSGKDAFGEDSQDVLVEFEETDWRSYPTTDGIPYTWKIGKENRKLGVVYELNAIHPNQKAKTLLSNMGAMIAPMYRGSLIIVGRDVKPHDVVYLNDTENDMRGHFEVESCTHHFSVGTGWITDINPCALVRVNNPTSELQLASMQNYMSTSQFLLDALDWGLTIFTIAGFFLSGPVAGAIAGAVRGIASGVGRAALAGGRMALSRTISRKLVLEAMLQFTKQSFTFTKNFAVNRFGSMNAARIAAKQAGSNQALAMASNLGGFFSPRGIALLMGVKLFCKASDAATCIYVKHLLSSTELPIDVHLLLYRGQVFQAGLDIDDADIYSMYDKMSGIAREMKSSVGDFFSSIADDLAGVERGSTPLDLARRSRDAK